MAQTWHTGGEHVGACVAKVGFKTIGKFLSRRINDGRRRLDRQVRTGMKNRQVRTGMKNARGDAGHRIQNGWLGFIGGGLYGLLSAMIYALLIFNSTFHSNFELHLSFGQK